MCGTVSLIDSICLFRTKLSHWLSSMLTYKICTHALIRGIQRQKGLIFDSGIRLVIEQEICTFQPVPDISWYAHVTASLIFMCHFSSFPAGHVARVTEGFLKSRMWHKHTSGSLRSSDNLSPCKQKQGLWPASSFVIKELIFRLTNP